MLVFHAKIGGTDMNPEHCTMKWVGNVRKMSSVVDSEGRVHYEWRGKDVLEDMPICPVNEWIGQEVRVSFEGVIHCVETGKAIKKTAPAAGGMKTEKRKIRYKPGTVTLREIKKYQKTTDMLLPRAPFQRLVRSICTEMDHSLRFQSQALVAL